MLIAVGNEHLKILNLCFIFTGELSKVNKQKYLHWKSDRCWSWSAGRAAQVYPPLFLLMTANDFSKSQLEISEESVEKTPSAQVSCSLFKRIFRWNVRRVKSQQQFPHHQDTKRRKGGCLQLTVLQIISCPHISTAAVVS